MKITEKLLEECKVIGFFNILYLNFCCFLILYFDQNFDKIIKP